jgi:hypothetical protein
MKNKNAKIDKYQRKATFTSLEQFCIFDINKPGNFIEVTEWANGEGFDVEINNSDIKRFQLTFGEFDALKHLIKNLYKD